MLRDDALFTPTGITSEAGSSAAITDHVVVVRRCCEWLSVLPHSGIALPGRLLGGPDPARMTLHSNAKPPTSRSTRLATKERRLVRHATERGCTRPAAPPPPYWCEVHHASGDWADGGQSNIDDLTLACGPDSRLVKEGAWRTRKPKDGRTEWIPPPGRDSGRPRTNTFHHPEDLLRDED